LAVTYYPIKCSYVNASSPHPKNTKYKISIGLEKWGDTNTLVSKVQIVYNGKVSGRKSPSFPVGTNDFHKVSNELINLLEEYRNNNAPSAFGTKVGVD
jgi:hypothetical protein